MSRDIRVAILAFVLMSIAAFLAVALAPTQYLSQARGGFDLATVIPPRLGEWQEDVNGPVVVLNPQQQAIIEKIYTQTLARTYVNRKGERVMLSIAYGADQRDGMQLHYPEVCYPAQGFVIHSNVRQDVTLLGKKIPVRRLETTLRELRYEPLTYWFTVGNYPLADSWKKKPAELDYSLRRRLIPDGLLVRVSSIGRDSVAAYHLQDDFIRQLAKSMAPVHRDQFFGI
ncbi:exosortase-associated protein EpsI, B-type [Craterilacuibacter sp. RT1T]|uniref:exosortase-associated protein EpsI, B-type n=1 Tax=Craterilacuibacter sp. RT1T TaxID=2942211 RepID=UPI0020BF4793|nr:exosortase-associated protein EpsI, B-type [Craterilacuibacter sp. RT1T]MCL6262740.1 EpsI family protein [Craterilacuibacter sp. RT1T]